MSRPVALSLGVLGALALLVGVMARSEEPVQTQQPVRPAPAGPGPATPAPSSPAPASPAPATRPSPPTPQAAAAIEIEDKEAAEQFKKDVQAYVDIHRATEKQLPDLPTEATIQQIDQRQRAMLKAMAGARTKAQRGDLFKPAMETTVRRMLARVFDGIEGRQLREAIMEDNPATIQIGVNSRYPDTVPLATMPPEVLQALPKMPEELEYRFVGTSLVIMDVHAHMIADFIPNALPR
jgi:ribosomal protein L29